jgi:hypothetical protein
MSRRVSDLEGIAARYATFQAAGSISAVALVSGAAYVLASMSAVTLTGNGQMGLGDAGDPLDGIIEKYENDGYMNVQVGGYKTAPGVSGALPTAGDFVCVDGAGLVSKCATQTAAGRGPARAAYVDNTASVNTVQVFIG